MSFADFGDWLAVCEADEISGRLDTQLDARWGGQPGKDGIDAMIKDRNKLISGYNELTLKEALTPEQKEAKEKQIKANRKALTKKGYQ